MDFIRRWRTKRRVKRQMEALLAYIEQQLEAGVHPNDMLVYEIRSAVEWDVPLQAWKIYFSGEELGITLEVDELVYLVRGMGRGGSEEHARVIDEIGDGWYTVRFDVKNRTVEADGVEG